jgi:hypothetical protein
LKGEFGEKAWSSNNRERGEGEDLRKITAEDA